jgi:thiosulfate/3-mercaptopyruvate sulfurtransferase
MALMTPWFSMARAAIALPGPLVTAAWLNEHQAEVQIVDVRDDLNSLTAKPTYSTTGGKRVLEQVGGHIPDALSVNFWGLRTKQEVGGKTLDFQLVPGDELQARMRGVQLEPNKPIVITPTGDDATSLQEAAFFAWVLQVYGVPAEQISILNGGVHAWIAAGLPLDTDAIAPLGSTQWTAQARRSDMLADRAQVQTAQRKGQALFDVRPLAQFAGLEQPPAGLAPGRLEGSRPLPAELFYKQAADGSWRFLTPEENRSLFTVDGIPRPQKGILYCNTGQYAAGAWFALERVQGLSGMRIFPGGVYEWVKLGLPLDPR